MNKFRYACFYHSHLLSCFIEHYVFENFKSIDVILKIEDDVILNKVYRTSVSAHDLLGPVSEHSFN